MAIRLQKGRWEVQFSQGGRRVHRVLPEGSTREQAKKLEIKLRREVFDTDELDEIPDYTLGEAIMRYLKEFQGKSKKQTESHARTLAPFISGRTIRVVCDVSDGVRREIGVSNSTKNRRLAILRRVASLAYRRWGWLKEPLHEKIEMLPENPARTVYLDRGGLAALLKGIRGREARRACLIAAFTGLRKGELLALEPADVSEGLIYIRDSKTGSPRVVPAIKSIQFALRRLPLKVDRYHLSKVVHKASGGKVRFHDLRHTCASLLAQEGVDLYVIGQVLGHKSIQTTKRYSHLSTKTLETAMGKLQRKAGYPPVTRRKEANG